MASGTIGVFSARLSSVGARPRPRGSSTGLGGGFSRASSSLVAARSRATAIVKRRASVVDAVETASSVPEESVPDESGVLGTVASVESLRQVKTRLFGVLSTAPDDRSDEQLDVVVRELADVPFLQQLRRDMRLSVVRILQMREAPRGTVIAREGSRGTELYIVYFGTCTVAKRVDTSAAAGDGLDGLGAEQCILEPGDAFGERALLTDAVRRKVSVMAKTDCVLLVLTREAFLQTFSNQVGWAPPVARTVLSKEKRTEEDMEAVIVYLSSISFFRQMSREEMEGVGSSFKLHSLGANQPLFEKGDPVESLWVVLSGRVALQPRAESMTAASPKARLSRSLPSRVSKLNRSTNRRISVLEAGFAPQSTGNKDGSIAKDGLGDAHPSGNDAAADDSSIVWYRPGDAFGDAELRAHHGAVGLYAAVEPTELLELPRAGFDFLGSLLDRHGVVFPMASCLEALKREASTRTDRDLRLILSLVNTISVFQHLPIPKRTMLCRSLTLQERPKGSVVCRQGDEGDTFYIVVTGSVGIWIRGEPDTTSKRGEPDAEALGSCVHVMTAGDSFGERSLLLAEKRSASVVCREPLTQLVCVKRNAFDAVADEDLVLAPRLSVEILKMPPSTRTAEALHFLKNFVRKIRFFHHLSPSMLTNLLPGLSHQSIARDALVFREGQKCGDVFVVLQGCVALHSRAAGVSKASRHEASTRTSAREKHGDVLFICDRGDLFGEYELSDANRQYTAVGKEDTEIIVIAAELYAALLSSEEGIIRQELCRRALLNDRSLRTSADVDLVFAVLNSNAFLAQLPAPKLRAVCRAVTLRDFKSNEVICEQGADGDALFLILTGSCDVFSGGAPEEHEEAAAQGGAEAIPETNATEIGAWGRRVNVMTIGDAFGETSLESGEAYGATVVTREQAAIITLQRADYDEILSNLDCRLALRPNEISRRIQALQNRALRVGESDQVIRALRQKMFTELLRPLAVFEAMDEETFARFCRLMRPLTVAADDQIYPAGAAPSFIAVLVVGSVEFISRGTSLHTAHAGDQIGNLELILGCPRLVEARAVVDTFMMAVSDEHYRLFWQSVHDEEQHTTARLLRSFPSLLTMAAADQFSVFTTSRRKTFTRGTLLTSDSLTDEVVIILEGECELQLRRNTPKRNHHTGAAKTTLALATVGARTCFGDLWPRAEEHTLALDCRSEVVMLMLPKPLVVACPVVVEELTVGLSHVITWSSTQWSATQMARPPVDTDARTARRTMPISACEVPLVPNQPISHGADGFIALPDSQLHPLKSHGRRAASKVTATTSSPVVVTAPPAKTQHLPVVRPEDFSTRQLARAHRAACPAMPANTYGRRFEHLALRTTKRPQLGPSSVLRGSNRQRRLVELFTHA